MLCPKCKFISFDHLPVCGKCHGDLTAVAQALRGTAVNVLGQMFLGTAFKDGVVESSDYGDVVVGETLAADGIGDGEAGVALLAVEEEAPALEFDESEIPHIDSVGGDVAGEPEIAFSLPVDHPPVEELSLAVASDEGIEVEPEGLPLPEEESVSSGDGALLEIDEAALTLDAVAGEQQSAVDNQDKDTAGGQMTLDLDEIDLSDLTNAPAGGDSSAAKGDAQEGAIEGASFEDTMDLSLLLEEVPGEEPVAAGEAGLSSDLAPIDLTLMDDALVELTVDHGRDDHSGKNEEQDTGFQLSMEDGER